MEVLVAQLWPTLATPRTIACQDPWPMEFSRQEYWSGLLFPSPGDLPHPGFKPHSAAFQADSLLSEPTGKPTKCTVPEIERREKKSFLSKQYKEIEKNDRMEKYFSSRKLEIPRENFIQRWAQEKIEMTRI